MQCNVLISAHLSRQIETKCKQMMSSSKIHLYASSDNWIQIIIQNGVTIPKTDLFRLVYWCDVDYFALYEDPDDAPAVRLHCYIGYIRVHTIKFIFVTITNIRDKRMVQA